LARKSIGIDIGTHSIKGVEIVESKSKIEIVKAAEVYLEPGAVVNGSVYDYDAIVAGVDQLYVAAGFKKSPVTVGMGGPNVYPRAKEFIWEPEETFNQALPYQVSDMLDNPEDYIIQHHPMGQYEDGTPVYKQKSMVVAAPFMEVEEIGQALLAADVKLRKADYVPFALVRAADGITKRKHAIPAYPKPDEDLEVEVIIDIGASLTTIAIHDRGCILFLRTFPGGSAGITQALQEQLSLSYEVAEDLKKNLGISQVTEELRKKKNLADLSDEEHAIASQIGSIIAGSWIQQIRETVDYWVFEVDNSVNVKRILLSGGGVKFGGFAQRVASELRAPVGLLKPLKAYGTKQGAKPNLDPRMSVAFGLALDSRMGGGNK
jgi:type IV pilus assembly protein PilM